MEPPVGQLLAGNLLQRAGLLTHETVKRRSVAYYAGRLCVTPKYLATICQRESGKSPREWIREYTLVDIAYYLKKTTLTIKEIADRLEFPNLSFFGRYVREHLGVSPPAPTSSPLS